MFQGCVSVCQEGRTDVMFDDWFLLTYTAPINFTYSCSIV